MGPDSHAIACTMSRLEMIPLGIPRSSSTTTAWEAPWRASVRAASTRESASRTTTTGAPAMAAAGGRSPLAATRATSRSVMTFHGIPCVRSNTTTQCTLWVDMRSATSSSEASGPQPTIRPPPTSDTADELKGAGSSRGGRGRPAVTDSSMCAPPSCRTCNRYSHAARPAADPWAHGASLRARTDPGGRCGIPAAPTRSLQMARLTPVGKLDEMNHPCTRRAAGRLR